MLRNLSIILRSFNVKLSTSAKNVPEFIMQEEETTRLLKVAVIGVPNAGKSTFINNLMDRKVCPTSTKVHTTRAKSRAVFTEADSQIVFFDTPGLVNLKEQKKFNLEKSFLRDSKASLHDADIIGVIHDASNVWTREILDIKVIRLLEHHKKKPSFLVFNKVDIIKSKRKLLDLTRMITENSIDGKPLSKNQHNERKNIRGWPYFQEIFMVSSLTGSGLPEVKNYLIEKAKPGKWIYPPDVWSDQSPEDIIVKSVKAKFLDFLQQEIPYNLKPEIELYEVNKEGVISTVVLVHAPTERIAHLVAGESDGRLRQITESVQQDLQQTFQNYVRIRIVMQSKKE